MSERTMANRDYMPFIGKKAYFRVLEHFSNSAKNDVTIETGLGGGDCGYDFKEGERYLVYAYENKGRIITTICSRTRPLSKALDDIAILRESKAGGKAVSRVFGQIVLLRETESDYAVSPIESAQIRLKEDGKQVATTTSELNGRFGFTRVKPGRYELEAIYRNQFTKSTTVNVGGTGDSTCIETNYYFKLGSRITGTVTDETGKPIARIRVIAAYFKKTDDEKEWSWFEGYSDKNGRFEIEGLSNGIYTLGVNFDGPTKKEFPFPPTYFPGVHDSKQAKRIILAEEKSYDSYDLKLSPRLIPRAISGVVLFPNGRPAIGTMVKLKEITTNWVMDETEVDSNGRFSLSAFEGYDFDFYLYNGFESWGLNQESKKIVIPKSGPISFMNLTVPFPKSK